MAGQSPRKPAAVKTAGTATGTPRHSARGEAARQRLKEAAARVLERVGYRQMRVADVERQREVTKWQDEFTVQRDVIARQREAMLAFAEQLEVSKRAVSTIEGFQDTIRREMNQVAELERMSEERQRKEMETWQAENEKRWKRQILQWEHEVQEQDKINRQLAARFPSLEERQRVYDAQIQHLWRLHETEGLARLAEGQRWLGQLEEALKARVSTHGE